MDLESLLRNQSAVIARWQALQYLSPAALLHKTTSGRWRRVHRLIYVADGATLTPQQCKWVAVLAASGDGGIACLAGLSALEAWGLRGVQPSRVDVLVSHDRRVQLPRFARAHRTRCAPDLAPGHHLRPPAAPLPRSLVDAVQWARSDSEARLIIAASFQQGRVTMPDVRRECDLMPKARRRALILATATDCAGGSHSSAELDLLEVCRRFRLPTPTRQALRYDRAGRRRYLDAVFEPWKVAVEIDGAHHLDVGHMWDDALRANALELDGYVVLRYPAHAVRSEARRIAAEIREALRNAGWHDAGHTRAGR